MVSSLCWISPHTHTPHTVFLISETATLSFQLFLYLNPHIQQWAKPVGPTLKIWLYSHCLQTGLPASPRCTTNSKQIILLKTIRISLSQWEKPKSFPCPAVPYITRPASLSDLQLCCSPPCSFHSWAHHVSSHISLCVSWSFHRSTLSPGIYLSPFLRNFLQSSGQTSYQRGPPWPPSVKQETFLLNPLTHSVVTGLLFVSAHKYAISTKPRALAAVLIAVPLVPNTGPTLRRYSRSLC